MQGKTKERWMELCEQAAVEQDREKLLLLSQEINRLLQEKESQFAKLRNDEKRKTVTELAELSRAMKARAIQPSFGGP
jgi:hypothetical protein